jgi:hypothetical protein
VIDNETGESPSKVDLCPADGIAILLVDLAARGD